MEGCYSLHLCMKVNVSARWLLPVTMYLSGSLYPFNSRRGWLHLSTTCGESERPLTCWQYNPPYNYLRCNSCSDSCGWDRRGGGCNGPFTNAVTRNFWAQHHSQHHSSTWNTILNQFHVSSTITIFRTSLPNEYFESSALSHRADWQ